MLRRTALWLLALTLIAACTDTTGPDRVTGTWRLQTVNGGTLPFTIPDDNFDKLEITENVITIADSGRFTDRSAFRITDGGVVSTDLINAQGSYTLEGSVVTLTYDEDGAVFSATVSGNTMTLVDGALTFMYRRD